MNNKQDVLEICLTYIVVLCLAIVWVHVVIITWLSQWLAIGDDNRLMRLLIINT